MEWRWIVSGGCLVLEDGLVWGWFGLVWRWLDWEVARWRWLGVGKGLVGRVACFGRGLGGEGGSVRRWLGLVWRWLGLGVAWVGLVRRVACCGGGLV